MATDLARGSVFAGYRIERVAGRGGMGVVFEATQVVLDRRVALKLIAPEFAYDAAFRERFKRESMTAAKIEHPNVIPIYEAGESNERLFISMRFVHGTDLRALIAAEGRLDPPRAAGIVAQVAAALDAAHQRGLVHRDVKPANILIARNEGDHAYLTDFGLTKSMAAVSGLTRTGQFVGTPDYAAPEQIKGERADARADVYALGCVLYQALTGRVPYPRDSEVAKIYAHLSEPPPTVTETVSGVPSAIDGVIVRALAKERGERYPSAGDLGRAALAVASPGAGPLVQSERSVATGAAAPESGPAATARVEARRPTEAAAEPTVAAPAGTTQTAATQRAGREEAPTAGPALPPTAPPAPGPAAPRPPRRAAEERSADAAPGPPAGSYGRRVLLLAAAAGALVLLVTVLLVAGVLGGGEEAPREGSADAAQETGPGAADGEGDADGGRPRVVATIEVGGAPDGMAIDGDILWVTDQDEDVLKRVDVTRNENIGKAIAVGQNPDGVVAADGIVWVANIDDGTVMRLETGDGGSVTNKSTVNLGGRPEGLALGSQLVWVTTGPTGSVSRIDRASATAVGSPIGIGSNTIGIVVGEDAVYATDKVDDAVTPIDAATGEISGAPTPVGRLPRGLVEAEGLLWVANSGDDTVSRVDPDSGEVVGRPIKVGDNPRDVTFAAGFVWVANTDSGTVTRIDASAARVAGRPVRVGAKPASIVAGAGSVWVSNSGDGTLSRVEP